MIEEIRLQGKVIALILDVSKATDGAHPATDLSWPLQLLLMKRKKGHVVANHMHEKVLKSSEQPQEAIVVVAGSLRVKIFGRDGTKVGVYEVFTGQCMLIADGAHEVEMTSDTLAYEFKTGPYVPDKIMIG